MIGKLRSSQNSFQHGLYSKQLITPGEDPAELDHLRATLRNEHQPANTTEEILVDELAQHFWRMRRFRELEARAWQPENLDAWCNNGLLALVQRSMASAERGFHKSLTTLQRLQKRTGREPAPSIKSGMRPRFVSEPKTQCGGSADLGAGRESVVRDKEMTRGFVPPKTEPASSHVRIIEVEEHDPAAETKCVNGFVPQEAEPNHSHIEVFEIEEHGDGFVPSDSFEILPYTRESEDENSTDHCPMSFT